LFIRQSAAANPRTTGQEVSHTLPPGRKARQFWLRFPVGSFLSPIRALQGMKGVSVPEQNVWKPSLPFLLKDSTARGEIA